MLPRTSRTWVCIDPYTSFHPSFLPSLPLLSLLSRFTQASPAASRCTGFSFYPCDRNKEKKKSQCQWPGPTGPNSFSSLLFTSIFLFFLKKIDFFNFKFFNFFFHLSPLYVNLARLGRLHPRGHGRRALQRVPLEPNEPGVRPRRKGRTAARELARVAAGDLPRHKACAVSVHSEPRGAARRSICRGGTSPIAIATRSAVAVAIAAAITVWSSSRCSRRH